MSAAGAGRFLSSLFFVFFQGHSKREEEKEIKKKRKQLFRDDSELFAKVPFIVTQGGRPSPPGRKDFQRVLGPCLAAPLSRVPHLTWTLPGEASLFLVVTVHPEALPPGPACWL